MSIIKIVMNIKNVNYSKIISTYPGFSELGINL